MAINVNLQGLEIVGNQSNLTFNQIDANLSLPDFQVRAIYPTYKPTKLRVEMSIIDNQNNLITDSKIMLIQSGIAKSGVRSQFKDGIWSAEGSMADINDLLLGNKIEIGKNFNDPANDINNLFKVLLTLKDLSNSNYANQSNLKKEIAINYQCLELPKDIVAIIDSQKGEVDKKIIMDFVRYFNNPEDKKFEAVIAELQQIGGINPLIIEKINKTAFSIIGDKYGDYPLKLSLTGKCQEVLDRQFDLSLNQIDKDNVKNQANDNSSTAMIAGLVSAGALLLVCGLYYCKSKYRKASPALYFDRSEKANENQQSQVVQIKIAPQNAQIELNSQNYRVASEIKRGDKDNKSLQNIQINSNQMQKPKEKELDKLKEIVQEDCFYESPKEENLRTPQNNSLDISRHSVRASNLHSDNINSQF